MDKETLKKLAKALGVDPSKITEKQIKDATDLFSAQPEQTTSGGPQSGQPTSQAPGGAASIPLDPVVKSLMEKNNRSSSQPSALDSDTKDVVNSAVKDSLVSDPQTEKAKEVDLAEREIANRMSPERDVVADRRGSYKNDLRKLQNERRKEEGDIRKEVYGERGLEIPKSLPGADRPDALRDNRIPAAAERNRPAQAEAERRDTIRSDTALNVEQNLRDGRSGRNVFADENGKVVGPAQLQQDLIAGGMNRNDASIAAGQRYRDMFDLPNAKSQGFGMRGGQRDAVLNAAPEDRMTIMEGLKNARRDNLQEIARQRNENPRAAGFSGKEVGRTMQIETQDGQILAKRTPEGGGGVVANGRTGTEGALELTDAGERAIRDRRSIVPTSQTDLAAYDESGGRGNVVTGKYGYAIGGVSGENLKVENGTLVAKALTKSREQGTVDSKAGALMDKFPGAERGIDQRWAAYDKSQKEAQDRKLGNDYLNAYEQAGGKTSPVKPDAESPGPRTDAEKGAMRGFVNKAPSERNEIVKGLTASPEAPAKKGESDEARRKRQLALGRNR